MTVSTIPSDLARLPFLREAHDPHGACLTDDKGSLDNAAFAAAVRRLTDRFTSLGVSPGDTVAVMLPNCSEVVIAVVGRPDPVYGEVPVAFVTTRPGLTVTADELLAHCATSLARYKVPDEIHVRTDLPKNSVGKLVKSLLRDQVRS